MPKKSKRLQRMIAAGRVPYICAHCDRPFASDRDRSHHIKDAHGPNARPSKVRKARHMPKVPQQQDNHALVVVGGTDAPATKPGILGTLFSGKKPKDELFVVDFVTPHTGLACVHRDTPNSEPCGAIAIPLTGCCIDHDRMCGAILMARALKAQVEADAARKKLEAANDPFPETPPYKGGSFWDGAEHMMH